MRFPAVPLVAAALLVGGCASTPKPEAQVAAVGDPHTKAMVALDRTVARERACQIKKPTGSRVPRLVCRTAGDEMLAQEMQLSVLDAAYRLPPPRH